MKILLTGFKPFNKDKINPTEQILEKYENNEEENTIFKLLLNVEYKNDSSKIREKIEQVKPDLVIMMGLAGGRNNINLEKVALNFRHATIPDNAGILIENEKIFQDAPTAYETKLDLKCIIKNVNSKRLSISYSAGTFICNDVYFSTLDYINRNNLNINALFIHFPFLPEQSKNKPTMELDEMLETLDKIISYISKK